MFNTLLTPSEVIAYTGISKEFPKCSLRTLYAVEFEEFLTCFGVAFYDHLISKKVDYSSIVIYNNTKNYVIGDVVSYDGVYYTATNATVGNIPTNESFWTIAPKFSEACLNTMWCTYMAEYLSWRVIFDRLPFINTQLKANGLVKLFGNSFKSGSKNDFETYSKAVLRSAERSFRNLDYYMRKNNDDKCFDLYKPLGIDCCSDCGCTNDDCDCETCHEEQSDGYGYTVG